MKLDQTVTPDQAAEYEEPIERVGYDFGLSRRSFVQLLGAGLMIASSAAPVLAQQRRGGGGFGGTGARTLSARIHIGADGTITVLTGKVEAGQGARAELTQAAAEELGVAAASIRMVMADTTLAPNDGITAGSGSTPRTVPAIRQAAAAARNLLIAFASKEWSVEPGTISVKEGKAMHASSGRSLSYAEFAANAEAAKGLEQAVPSDISLTPVKEWRILGTAALRPNGIEVVTGRHKFPSDMAKPGSWYGKVLRPPSYGAKLTSLDLDPVRQLKDVVALRDDQFAGVAAPTAHQAEEALAVMAKSATWEPAQHPSSNELFGYLKDHADGGIPKNPFPDELAQAAKVLRQTYEVAYVQHSPLEPRAAVAEWVQGKLTVWTGSQNPFGCRSELARAFHLQEEDVRVIVPDFGAGFGGKHTGEAAVEAARLSQAANHPVCLRWTRQEEFTWAYFRPAAVILAEASLDSSQALSTWHFININSGPSAVETPYRSGKKLSKFIGSKPPLRHGSYRALASTANNFARECFIDELAAAASADPLEFRLSHLDAGRLRSVLETAAQRFDWKKRAAEKQANVGVGLACGTEKGSYVAACVEVAVDRGQKKITVRHVSQVFECGAILNPDNLLSQVQGAIVMGLGPALREEMIFEKGEMLNASFRKYQVPRFDDLPILDIHLLNRPDLPPAGAGETPIIAIAPAIANAVFAACGQRIRSMPIRLA
jgi:isoquinoline 1-oxidoreductase